MSFTLVARRAVLMRKLSARPGVEVWAAFCEQQETEAVAYPALTGGLMAGDQVLINTTAVELQLGTGGQHFIIARMELGSPVPPHAVTREDGHIVKLRYTPLQGRVLAVEEEASPYHDAMQTADRLPGTPVICLGLHSQLAPAAAGVKAVNPALRVGFLMTDSAALPLVYSRLVPQLVDAGLLDATVTAGQAFGGELEAVNLYSGLVAAVVAREVDVLITGQGPGNVGTATPLGFGGLEQAQAINAAASLEGRPIAVPRLSFADPRARHHGISHHTLTVLGRLALASAVVPLPLLDDAQQQLVTAQLAGDGLSRHRIVATDGVPGIALCRERGISLTSMGRAFDEDPAFFLAAAAAGRVAAEML